MIIGLFFVFQNVFAGTLTDTSFTWTSDIISETNTLTFEYTNETFVDSASLHYVFRGLFGTTYGDAFFDFNGLDGDDATVTLNGVPATITEGSGYTDGFWSFFEIRIAEDVPALTPIVVTINNVINHDTAGIYTVSAFGTADNGANLVDTPENGFAFELLEEELVEFAGGDGSENDPYQIQTCEQLQAMNQELDAYYVLVTNIDCSETSEWNPNTDEWVDGIVGGELIPDSYEIVNNNGYKGFEPIGQDDAINTGSGFTGVLDGQGYTISDLWIFRKEAQYDGLIGYATNATIKNITLDNPRVVGGSYTGGFLGFGSGVTLEHLTNTSGMVRAYLSYHGGGIAGYLTDMSTATGLTVTDGTVHGSGNIIGGLVGALNNSTVIESDTNATVDGGEYIGGAFGQIYDSEIDTVYATGDVFATFDEGLFAKSGDYSGGFAGMISNSLVSDSYAYGTVTSEGGYSGGFVGQIAGTSTITSSFATGSVTAEGGHVGGFAGQITDEASLEDVYATGNAQGIDTVGGFVGGAYCGPTFLRAYALGNVTGNDSVGGFTGSDGCEGPGAYYYEVSARGNVSGQDGVGGFVGTSYVSDFTDVYAGGSVTGRDEVGGFGGYVFIAKIDNAYARGAVVGIGENVGGFIGINYIGEDDRIITDSFFDTESSGQLSACEDGDCTAVVGEDTLTMQTSSTFTDVGWDFEDIWSIDDENDGYPKFIWESTGLALIEISEPVVSDITKNSATISATITDGEADGYGFFWGTESYTDEQLPAYSQNIFSQMAQLYPSNYGDGSQETAFSAPFEYEFSLDFFECDTTYYVRPLAYLSGGFEGFAGLGIGEEISFATLSCDNEPEQPRRSSGGSASSTFLAQLGITTTSDTQQKTVQSLMAEVARLQKLLAELSNNQSAPTTPNTPQPILRIGSTGESVLLVQRWLGVQPQSGRFITITDAAVKAFQRQHGLQPDGIVGPATWVKLFAVFGNN